YVTFNFSLKPASGDVAQDFAAHAGGAGLAIGHHATRGGHDRHAQTVLDLGDGIAATVDAQAGTAHALDELNDGTTGVVLQGDFEFALAFFVDDLEAVDATLVLQDLGNRRLHFGRRHRHGGLLDHLRVADA